MSTTNAFVEQIGLVLETRKIVLEYHQALAAIEAEIGGGIDRRERERAGSSYPNPQLARDCREEFAVLNQAKFDVEQRLEHHEATLSRQVERLLEIGDILAAQVGQVNQPQQQAAPAPQTAVSVSSGPAAQQQHQKTEKRFGCSICWARGITTDWDRTSAVEAHVKRVHGPGVGYHCVDAPRRSRK